MDLREARVRLEGALELVEAGIARYRRLRPRLRRDVPRDELELLIDTEEALETAAAQVSRLAARAGPADLNRALEALGAARRALRLKLRKRLDALSVQPMMTTLAQEAQLLLDHTLPAPSVAPVAWFDLRSRADFALAWACVLSALVFFSVAAFAPDLAWVAAAAPMIGAVTAWFGSRRKLALYPDRVRVVRRLGGVKEVALERRAQLGPLNVRTDFERGQLATLIELLQQPCFARVGEASGESLYEAEASGGAEAYAVVATTSEALLIREREGQTLDAAVGASRTWTQPRAALVAQLLVRLPPEDRAPIVERLAAAGLLHTVSRERLDRDFRILW